MPRGKAVFGIIFLLSLAGNIYFAGKYSAAQKEIGSLRALRETRSVNEKILNFNRMFLEHVLEADKEVDFETRLKLENAVRDIKDPEIMDQWNKFVNSKDEREAQIQMKNLLKILLGKINAG